ncbi:penicillin-binding protein activator [Lichenibacterium dinghuense]|uniref:penicillin-binding protein activator n=1 Tax=Lichenibacterium dinghuense TaxID=2895977 RepID=UPI001F43EA1B|nr:penicillin-binding protein activator [Lichenibacterium sp. 6Y81]
MSARSIRAPAVALASAALLSACGQFGGGDRPRVAAAPPPKLSAPVSPVESKPLTPATPIGAIGSGPVKVALILPLTQSNGGASAVGVSLRNAADLAYADAGTNDLTILVKDDHSTPDGAREAAQSAVADGAELIIGPVFAPDLREAAKVAKAADKPLIGFSTDTSTATRGVYLLSFLIESYVDRVVDYAAAHGKRSLGALVPDTDYGNVALAAYQQAAARLGVRVEAIERYKPDAPAEAVARMAAALPRIDALFIPGAANEMPAVAAALTANGIDSSKVQILGTGLWADPKVLKLPALQGAWFAAPENAGFAGFAQKYRAKYGTDPSRIATLSYDAVSLAAALAHQPGSPHFTQDNLTSSSGFNGADGVFRFRADGPNERGLAVLQIANGTTTVLSAAPRSFSANPS